MVASGPAGACWSPPVSPAPDHASDIIGSYKMSKAEGTDLNNPFFARFYRRNRLTAEKRGELEHKRRALAGLTGRVVEIGAGDGGNFRLYPPEVTEVVAVEPERHLKTFAEEAAAEAPVKVTVVGGRADASLWSHARATRPSLPSCSAQCLIRSPR